MATRAWPGFLLGGPKLKSRRPSAGVGFLGRGSNPLCPSARGSGERCELPQRGSGRSPDRPKVSTISTLRMSSPDTIIWLIVDYHAAIGGGGKTPVTLPCVQPCMVMVHLSVETRVRVVLWLVVGNMADQKVQNHLITKTYFNRACVCRIFRRRKVRKFSACTTT